ncbi:CBU_0592 family membrane protein [Mameliella sp.]|uniref:CBU_0592 family membrane protein n=1 Tax=Mameliella sp. TaxID=1924940 RepID=UPI003B504C0F
MIDFLSTAEPEGIFLAIGLCGFFLYVGVYAALSFRVVTGDCLSYFVGNTAAASLVLIGLSHEFNLASALIQAFWICIGIAAIVLRLLRRASDRRAEAALARRVMPRAAQANRTEAEGPRRQAASGYSESVSA